MGDLPTFDYKTPIGIKNDYRTSTYRGHRYIMNDMTPLKRKVQESKYFANDPVMEKLRSKSIYGADYHWQYESTENMRNPTLKPNPQFMKTFDECKLKFVAIPMQPACSVSRQDYVAHSPIVTPTPSPLRLPATVKTTRMLIDYQKANSVKFLDPAATTTRLDYVHYTPDAIKASVAVPDHITYWNWSKIENTPRRVFPGTDEIMCDKYRSNDCPKRRCEYRCMIKHVPHTGLTTEVRENYALPLKRAQDYSVSHLRNLNIHAPIDPSLTRTEYKTYGSGKCTTEFV